MYSNNPPTPSNIRSKTPLMGYTIPCGTKPPQYNSVVSVFTSHLPFTPVLLLVFFCLFLSPLVFSLSLSLSRVSFILTLLNVLNAMVILCTKQDMDTHRYQMDINYFGTLNAIHAVTPGMIEKQEGHIVLISSAVCFAPMIGYVCGNSVPSIPPSHALEHSGVVRVTTLSPPLPLSHPLRFFLFNSIGH